MTSMGDITFEDLSQAEQELLIEIGKMYLPVFPDAATVFARMEEIGLLAPGAPFLLTKKAQELLKAGSIAEFLHLIHDGWAEWELRENGTPVGQPAQDWTTTSHVAYEKFLLLSREKQIELIEQARLQQMGTKTVFARNTEDEFVETTIPDLSPEEFERISKTLIRDGQISVF